MGDATLGDAGRIGQPVDVLSLGNRRKASSSTLVVHTRRTLAVLALTVLGCASLAAASAPIATTSFDTTGFHTRYPSTWSPLQQSSQPSIGTSLIWLSNQPMHDPCTTTASGDGITSTCGFPIASLAPSGVVVHWSRDDGPNTVDAAALARTPGQTLQVDGHPAKFTVEAPSYSSCGTLTATREVLATILADDRAAFQMDACIRGPNLRKTENQLRHMTETTTFTP
jgi:hypothetical protein